MPDMLPEHVPLSEAEGGNPYAELIRRVRTTPFHAQSRSLKEDDFLLGTTSEVVRDETIYLAFLSRKYELTWRELQEEQNPNERDALIHVLIETSIEYQTLAGLWHMKLLTEFKALSGRSPAVTLRDDGVAVISKEDAAAYDSWRAGLIKALVNKAELLPLTPYRLLPKVSA